MSQRNLIVTNVQVVDVVHGSILPGRVSVEDGIITAVEADSAQPCVDGAAVVDGGGRYLVPGLIDSHMHIESSMATPRRFADAVVPAGTTTILADPHEMANVLGEAGVAYMLRASRGLPLRVLFSVPSCVPATSPELETSGAVWGPREIERVFALDERCVALGEMMDYRAVVDGEERSRAILALAERHDWLVEGHCPSQDAAVRGAYFASGIRTDHTLMDPDKIRHELELGVWVELQERSIRPENIAVLLDLLAGGGAVAGSPLERVLFVTDDFPPSQLSQGHLVCNLRKAIALGLPPLEALASATVRAARLLGRRDLGMIAPGCVADFFLTSDLVTLPVERVFTAGREYAGPDVQERSDLPAEVKAPVAVPHLSEADFTFPGIDGVVESRVIVTNGENSQTRLETRPVTFTAGVPQLEEDLVLVAVFERHGRNGNHALAFMTGYGRLHGAVASTVSHDCHNLVVIGSNAMDMAVAANRLAAEGGGFAVASGGEIRAVVPLPVAGLLSDEPVQDLSRKVAELEHQVRACGATHQQALTFLTVVSLTTSPRYKLSDRGLVDVDKRTIITLFPSV